MTDEQQGWQVGGLAWSWQGAGGRGQGPNLVPGTLSLGGQCPRAQPGSQSCYHL